VPPGLLIWQCDTLPPKSDSSNSDGNEGNKLEASELEELEVKQTEDSMPANQAKIHVLEGTKSFHMPLRSRQSQ
jgi:hypothetical protein